MLPPIIEPPAAPSAASCESTAAATPSIVSSEQSNQAASAMDTLDNGEASREPRSCVLRQRQEKNPLYKLLDYLLKVKIFEKKTFIQVSCSAKQDCLGFKLLDM